MTTADDLAIRGIDEVEPLDVEGSAIFRGRQRTHNRQVAVKILDPLQEPLVPRRFDIRRKALNRFAEQPGVVPVYEVGSTPDGANYLVMPYFRIGSLADQLSHGPTPWHRAAELVMQAARIVGRGHDLGVVLGDLKPSSIVLADASSPLISLYGMATRRFDDGSPRYGAPETLRGVTPAPPADVYSLSLTLAALIAGQAPNRGRPAPEFMAEVARLAPARILDVIDQGLSENPANRYGTCNHLARALELALAAEPEVAGAETDVDPIDWDSLLGPSTAPAEPGLGPSSNGASPSTTAGNDAFSRAVGAEPDELIIDLTDGASTPGAEDDPLGLDSGWTPDRPVPRPPAPPGSLGSPGSGSRSSSGSSTAVAEHPPVGIAPLSADAPSTGQVPASALAPDLDPEPTTAAPTFDPAATIVAAAFDPAATVVAADPPEAAIVELEPEPAGTRNGDADSSPIGPRLDAVALLASTTAPVPAAVAPPRRPSAWLAPDDDAAGPGPLDDGVESVAVPDVAPPPSDGLAGPIPIDDQIPFPAFERQPLPVPPENPLLRHWEAVQGAWFNRRRSYGGLLAVLGLAVIAGVVVWLLVRDLKPPSNVAPDSTFATFIDSSDASSNPTVVPPVLQEPPATNTTVPAPRPKPKATPKRTTTTAAPATTAPASPAPSAPATTAPATTAPATTAPATTATTATTRRSGTTAPPPTPRPTLLPSLPTLTPPSKPPGTGTTAAPQGLTLPLIDAADVTRIRATSARISLTSGSCVTAVFSYAAVGEAAREVPSSSCATAHTLLLGIVTPSLRSGTSYTVTVTVTDASGHTASQVMSFTTLG